MDIGNQYQALAKNIEIQKRKEKKGQQYIGE